MYQDALGFHARPFANYPGRQYFRVNDTVAELATQIQRIATARDAIAVVTGGPGVGKSALVEYSLFPIGDRIAVARADMREVPPAELYRVLLASLDEPTNEACPEKQLINLLEVIRQYHKNEMQVVMLVDVMSLDAATVAPISRLVHLAGSPDGQLNIVLQGPHTLHKFLDLPALMHLRQRISFRHSVRPFTYAQTDAYIQHQLKSCGGNAYELMDESVAGVVFQYVAGVPRLINTLMDAVLGEMQISRQRQATAQLAEQVAAQLGWRPLTNRPGPLPKSGDRALAELMVETRQAAHAAARPAPPAAPAANVAEAANHQEPPAKPAKPAPEPARSVEPKIGDGAGSAIPEMDPNDPGATGMLRLDQIDERFAETIFTDEPDFYAPLADGDDAPGADKSSA